MIEKNMSYHIKKTDYYYSEDSKALFEVALLKKTIFLPYGENLTICLLNLNRVILSIKLISSIEFYFSEFKGDILIIDNGSSSTQLQLLKEYISTSSLSIRINELNNNHGVGRARNIAAKECKTDWIMFLDNDMYFTENPMPYIEETIQILGCNFINLPLINYDNKTIFALGGALFTSPLKNSYFIGGGSNYDFAKKTEYDSVYIKDPFLSDFLFGGASVINRQEFLELGGFDHDMFVGFEDIDFSLRLYNKGIKIGNIRKFTLVHNHKPSSNIDDLEAEKKRFNNTIIKESADRFLTKNGLYVYDQNTETWLKDRQQQLNINNELTEKKKNCRKKIALIIDARDWAFDNIANNIVHFLSDKYEFIKYYHSDYSNEKWLDLYVDIFKSNPDILFFFWRPIIKHLFSIELEIHLKLKTSISSSEFDFFLNNTVILTCIYDHLFLQKEQIAESTKLLNNMIDGYFVSSNKLKKIYLDINDLKPPYSVIQDGVDLTTFYRKENAHFSINEKTLIVGWAGNSEWGICEDGIDHKGFTSIIKPAIQQLNDKGFNIILKYADKKEPETRLAKSKMNDFYNTLDVYLCTSDIEGTPNTILEAMATGIGIITTDVGIVKELLGKEQQKFILEDRSIECLKNKLITIIKNKNILHLLAKENSIRIKNWTWKNQCDKFNELFDYYLFKKNNQLTEFKTFPFADIPIQNIINENSFTENTIEKQPFETISKKIRKEYDELYCKLILDNKQKFNELKSWYEKEYESLPLWYKRFGHIIKVLKGKRSFKSLFEK